MVLNKLSPESYQPLSKTRHSSFQIHDKAKFGLFIDAVNQKLGKRAYSTFFELSHLGIVLNLEVGYMVHVVSTTDLSKNYMFGMTTSFRQTIKQIISNCDYRGEPADNINDVVRIIKLLYTENDLQIITVNKRQRFPIEYNTTLVESDTEIKNEKALGSLSVYLKPDPLLPIYSSFQCDICLKSLSSIRCLTIHITSTHNVPDGFFSKNFMSPSYSQACPLGLITVLVSGQFLELENSLPSLHRSKLKPYTIPENFISKDEEAILKRCKFSYTIREVSECDEMFDFDYLLEFTNQLELNDFHYYIDYLKMDSRLIKIKAYLVRLLFNLMVFSSKKYSFNKNLTTHKNKVLKFYITSINNSAFFFNRISNYERILKYAKYISHAILVIFLSYNLESKMISNFCKEPNFKVDFSEYQQELLEKIFGFVLFNYTLDDIKLYSQDQIKDDKYNPKLKNAYLLFWKDLQKLLIDFTLQETLINTPLQTLFSFSACDFDYFTNQLMFYGPYKRSVVFKSLFYIIRLSFFDNITSANDDTYNSLIIEATINGEIRNIMEKMYYPTLYYFLKKKSAVMQPFFNPEKYTYVHPVFLMNKFVGCKILGLHSINIMLEKIAKQLPIEFMYIKKFEEIGYDFDIISTKLFKMPTELEHNQENIKEEKNVSYLGVSEEFKKSLSVITCLLIGYLVLTNNPLLNFNDYFELDMSGLKFTNDTIEINTEIGCLTVEDTQMVLYFKRYQLLRSLVFLLDTTVSRSKFFLKFEYANSRTFFELTSCRYSAYVELHSFLRSAHAEHNSQRCRSSKSFLGLVKSQLRERSEGYLVTNLKLIAPDHQKYAGEDSNDVPDSRSYIKLTDNFNLNDIIECGFFDYQFDDTLNSDEIIDEADFINTESADPNDPGNQEHNHTMKRSKIKNSTLSNKRVKT